MSLNINRFTSLTLHTQIDASFFHSITQYNNAASKRNNFRSNCKQSKEILHLRKKLCLECCLETISLHRTSLEKDNFELILKSAFSRKYYIALSERTSTALLGWFLLNSRTKNQRRNTISILLLRLPYWCYRFQIGFVLL